MLILESFKSIKVNAKNVIGGRGPITANDQPNLTYSLEYREDGPPKPGINMGWDNPGGNP
jgi:hypothetical protein